MNEGRKERHTTIYLFVGPNNEPTIPDHDDGKRLKSKALNEVIFFYLLSKFGKPSSEKKDNLFLLSLSSYVLLVIFPFLHGSLDFFRMLFISVFCIYTL